MIHYRIPEGVSPKFAGSQVSLSNREGGRVWIDRRMLDLWKTAHDRTAQEILANFRSPTASTAQVLSGLACLAEAGLLVREGSAAEPEILSTPPEESVSIIIVTFNSRVWLPACMDSISVQTCSPLEIIIVDNSSQDNSAGWIAEHHPEVRLVRLPQTVSLANALNIGIREAVGRFFLLLNPDVCLAPDVIASMLQRFHAASCAAGSSCAAVSARLRLLWAPKFLNGLGNMVGAAGWGTDIGLGHLDLGQFDHLEELPSACFAAALIPAWAIQKVGPIDEGFPMYYEDSEWCYRARLLGCTIASAPQAIVYHAFSAQLPSDQSITLTPSKIQRVTSGRLRFITRINGVSYYWRFLFNYLMEDIIRFFGYLIRLQPKMAMSIVQGFSDYLRSLPVLLHQRAALQSRRQRSDKEIYRLQKNIPVPLIHAGAPLLTWDAVTFEYLPLILTGRTRMLPEFEEAGIQPSPEADGLVENSAINRWLDLGRLQGFVPLLKQLARRIQWRLMQP